LTEDSEQDSETIGPDPFWTASCRVDCGIDFEVLRFYDGATTSESNFVGYGLLPFFMEPSLPSGLSNQSYLNITASAIFTDVDDIIGNSAGQYDCLGSCVESADSDWTFSYATVSGISFVRATYDYFQGSSPEPTREATIDSIEFYTY